jgi:hypothetical protein
MGMAGPNEPVRAALRECGWGILKHVTATPARPLAVRCGNRLAVVSVTLAARDAEPEDRPPGEHFSPLGAAIWAALADGPLPGKKVAARCHLPYTPGFSVILKEYVSRGVLGHNRTQGGYFRKVTTTHHKVTTPGHNKTR